MAVGTVVLCVVPSPQFQAKLWMLWPVAGVAVAVNVASWPTGGEAGRTLMVTLGAGTLRTMTDWAATELVPAASVTMSVTV